MSFFIGALPTEKKGRETKTEDDASVGGDEGAPLGITDFLGGEEAVARIEKPPSGERVMRVAGPRGSASFANFAETPETANLGVVPSNSEGT